MLGEEARQGRGSFFGRRKGKALRPAQRHALETVLPPLLIDISAPAPNPISALFPTGATDLRLEIGFGGGEHLVSEALAHPAVGFIGIEPFENGLAKVAAAIARHGIRNVRIFSRDATLLLDWLPPASLTQIDLLFPDPWPKTRHAKRRFVNAWNLQRIRRALQPGGCFRFATDVEAYAHWTRDAVEKHGGFVTARAADAESVPWQGWPGTRYEAKAIAAGRTPAYLVFRKLTP